MTVQQAGKEWSHRLDDIVWAYRTSFQTPFRGSPYRTVFGYHCHLPTDLQQRCYWTCRIMNYDLQEAGEKDLLEFHELDDWRTDAHDKQRFYKERILYWQYIHMTKDIFHEGQRVLFYHTWMVIFPGEIQSEWAGPYTISQVYYHGAVELTDEYGKRFKVNRRRIRLYIGIETTEVDE